MVKVFIRMYSRALALEINPLSADHFCTNHGDQKVFFNSKSSKMSWLTLPDSFEYLCYGSTTITHSFTLTVRGSTLVVGI